MRRMLGAMAALGLLIATVLFAAPAGAAPAPSGTCYPPGACHAQIFSSTTTPFQGQTIEVSGKFYLPNEDVRLTIGGIFVGTAHTDSAGAFDPPAVTPNLLGDQVLEGIGASGLPNDRDSLILNIRASGVAGTGSSGGLSSTGVAITATSLIGAALLIGGAFLTIAGRRRRSATHTA